MPVRRLLQKDRAPFTLLEDGQPRWRSVGAGFGIEFALLICALWLPLLFPKQMKIAQRYLVTEIIAPPISAWRPQPTARPRPTVFKKPEVVHETPVPDPPKPRVIEPVFEKPIAAKPAVKKNLVPVPKINDWARITPQVPSDSLGSSAAADLKRPRPEVQTGGFGDPQGLPATAKVTHAVNINQAGGFDMPAGPGKGNGRGGARGVSGVVASAGFGDETAAGSGGRVRKAAAEVTPNQEPVVILYKPTPEYTAEGRQLKIQGEVLIQVVFTASGQVQVERVVKGLGHGLDENAEVAARQIRFKPARQDGQPVDFPAIVRIQFELAY